MTFFRKIAFPLNPLYYLATWIRNKLYDLEIKKSTSYDFPVICVGNLSVGGTGKTPMIEYLVKLLKHDFTVATLSRGYKRKSEGFQLGDKNASVETLGDEPFQFYSKFKNDVLVAVDADRREGIKSLRDLENAPEIILLDDAFQHRRVKAGLYILLTTYSNLYINDVVLPVGDLRESKSGAKRADVIMVTKCPTNLSAEEQQAITKLINPEANQHVFFSNIAYASEIISDYNGVKSLDILDPFTLVTGIANAKPLVDYLEKQDLKFDHLNFKDHHEFSDEDISRLNEKELIITTEKDYMRLKQYQSLSDKLYYLPISVSINNSLKFNELIKAFVKRD